MRRKQDCFVYLIASEVKAKDAMQEEVRLGHLSADVS